MEKNLERPPPPIVDISNNSTFELTPTNYCMEAAPPYPKAHLYP